MTNALMLTLVQDGGNYVLNNPISEAAEALSKKVFDLTEEGQTALGPALVASVGIAAQRNASEVIICTDGLANVGLGAIDENQVCCCRFHQRAYG